MARAIPSEITHDHPELSYRLYSLKDVVYQLSLKTIFEQYQIPFYLGEVNPWPIIPNPVCRIYFGASEMLPFPSEDLINLPPNWSVY